MSVGNGFGNTGDWTEERSLVMNELKRLNKDQETADTTNATQHKEMMLCVTSIKVDVARLKVTVAIWASLFGVMAGAVVALIARYGGSQ